MSMTQAVGGAVAGFVTVVVVVDFAGGSNGTAVDVSNVHASMGDIGGVAVAGVYVGAEGGTHFCPSFWLAKNGSNIFAQ